MRKKILILLILSSCITEKRRLKICQSCALKIETVRKDSIGEAVITNSTFDSLIWIKNHSGHDQQFDNCDSLMKLLNKKDSLITISNGIKSTIKKEKGKIVFKCETDSLKDVIKMLKVQVETSHYTTIESKVEVPARCQLAHKTDFDGFCRWFFYIVAPAIALYVYLRIKRIIP